MKKPSPKSGPKASSPTLDTLKQASKGLMMPSESDAPFTAFAWDDSGDLTHERLLKLAKEPAGSAVEEDSLDNLLRTVPTEDRQKFDPLRKTLQEQLSGVKVFKVGDEAERRVYIVGKTKEGKWAGLRTTVVET
jgi:histidine triad (HIT) family protein